MHSSNPGSLSALFKPWFIECTLQTLLHWVHSSNPGSLGALFKPWFIGCTLQTLVHWVHSSNPGSLDAPYKPWFIGCTLQQHRIQQLGGGAKKHEIYVAAFGGHLFYDLFVQSWEGHGPLSTPGSATASNPGSLGALFEPWFTGCTLQTLVHWVHSSNPGSLGAPCNTLVHWVHSSNSGSLLIAKDFWLICRDDSAE